MFQERNEMVKEITKELVRMFQNGIVKDEIFELIQLGADSMKNSTYQMLLDSDAGYHAKESEIRELMSVERHMSLTEDQKEVVERIFARMEERQYHVIADAYMAGILDGYKLLKDFGLTRE